MKVLVADKFEKTGLDGLAELGCEVIYDPDLKEDALKEKLAAVQPAILVVRSTKVTSSILSGANLRIIIRAGAGYDTIDVEAASAKGTLVTNCPGKNSQAVAELAFGLMLAIDRKIPDNVNELRNGHWAKKRFSTGRGLYGRTLGLMGMGRIGQEMVPRAKAFGMHVVAYSRWMTAEVAAALGIGRARTLEELAVRSDVVSVHVSLSPETKGLVNEEFLSAMRPGAYLINTSRAGVVDQPALEKAVREGRVFAGLDVFEGEPAGGEGAYDGSLKDLANCYCTHHIGASTQQAQEAIADEVVRIVREYKTSGNVPNVVNVSKGGRAGFLIEVRHEDQVGVLAKVLKALSDEGINVQEMENTILAGRAAIAQIAVDKGPSSDLIAKLKDVHEVFDAGVIEINQVV